MAPCACLGFVSNAEEAADPCVFNGNGTGRPARALTHGRCVWCCSEEMARRSASPKLEKFLIYTLVNFKSANEEVFKKATGRLPEDRRADILAEVAARLEPEEEEDVEMEPAEKGADGESEENDAEAPDFAGLGILPDEPSDAGEGEEARLNIDAVDGGEVDFGDALDEVESPFESLKPERECPGRDRAACSWSTSQLEQPARTQPARGLTHCVFCGDAQLDKIQNGFQLTKTLKALRELDDAKYEAALENLKSRRGEAFAADFGSRVDLTIYRAVERQQAPRKSVPERWSDLLQRRVRVQGPLDGDALATY
ncbi:unnamed protein product, partial [Effrenium voratum]